VPATAGDQLAVWTDSHTIYLAPVTQARIAQDGYQFGNLPDKVSFLVVVGRLAVDRRWEARRPPVSRLVRSGPKQHDESGQDNGCGTRQEPRPPNKGPVRSGDEAKNLRAGTWGLYLRAGARGLYLRAGAWSMCGPSVVGHECARSSIRGHT